MGVALLNSDLILPIKREHYGNLNLLLLKIVFILLMMRLPVFCLHYRLAL